MNSKTARTTNFGDTEITYSKMMAIDFSLSNATQHNEVKRVTLNCSTKNIISKILSCSLLSYRENGDENILIKGDIRLPNFFRGIRASSISEVFHIE